MSIPFENFFLDLFSIIPEIFICFFILVFLTLGLLKGNQKTKLMTHLSCLVLAISLIIIIAINPIGSVFHGFLIHNFFTQYCKILILSSVIAVLLLSLKSSERESDLSFEFPILILFAALGMMLMVSANDLIMAYMALELQSFALYILIALKKESKLASEASLKYFILGALASVMILYGSSFLYGITGTTEFISLSVMLKQEAFFHSPVLLFSAGFILAGFSFKLALAPFHMWSPDIYEGSDLITTSLIASAPKIATFALFIRFFTIVLGSVTESWHDIVAILALLSIFIGAMGALYQTNIKRLLGYSAISHMGYAFLGLLNHSAEGIQSILLYLTLYIVMIIGLFSCLLNLRKNHHLIDNLTDLKGLSKDHPMMAIVMTIFLLSLAGIPPLAGFFSKLFIFNSVVIYSFKIAIAGILLSVISVGYSLKIIKIIYFEERDLKKQDYHFDLITASHSIIVLSIMTFITVFYILFPSAIMPFLHKATSALINSSYASSL